MTDMVSVLKYIYAWRETMYEVVHGKVDKLSNTVQYLDDLGFFFVVLRAFTLIGVLRCCVLLMAW